MGGLPDLGIARRHRMVLLRCTPCVNYDNLQPSCDCTNYKGGYQVCSELNWDKMKDFWNDFPTSKPTLNEEFTFWKSLSNWNWLMLTMTKRNSSPNQVKDYVFGSKKRERNSEIGLRRMGELGTRLRKCGRRRVPLARRLGEASPRRRLVRANRGRHQKSTDGGNPENCVQGRR